MTRRNIIRVALIATALSVPAYAVAHTVTLHGSDGPNVMNGHLHSDIFFAHRGNDSVYGRGANDYLYGNADEDSIKGGSADDDLMGGYGDDLIWGSSYLGPDGRAFQDGWDYVNGGPGSDICVITGSDFVKNCEWVYRAEPYDLSAIVESDLPAGFYYAEDGEIEGGSTDYTLAPNIGPSYQDSDTGDPDGPPCDPTLC